MFVSGCVGTHFQIFQVLSFTCLCTDIFAVHDVQIQVSSLQCWNCTSPCQLRPTQPPVCLTVRHHIYFTFCFYFFNHILIVLLFYIIIRPDWWYFRRSVELVSWVKNMSILLFMLLIVLMLKRDLLKKIEFLWIQRNICTKPFLMTLVTKVSFLLLKYKRVCPLVYCLTVVLLTA